MNYYGIDWIANLLFLTYIYLIGQKIRWAFLVAIFGCVFYVVFAWMANSWATVLTTLISLFLYARAYILWNKLDKVKN